MNKILISLLFLTFASIEAKEYIIVPKLHTTNIFKEIREKGYQVKDVQNLDQDACGNVLIIYE